MLLKIIQIEFFDKGNKSRFTAVAPMSSFDYRYATPLGAIDLNMRPLRGRNSLDHF